MLAEISLDCGLSGVMATATPPASLNGDVLLAIKTGAGAEQQVVGAYLTVKQARELADFLYSVR